MRRCHAAFTLVEMLLVVAIIALLISILLPTLGHTREVTRRITCATNLRNLVTGMVSYAMSDGRGNFMPTNHYTNDDISHIIPKHADRSAAICPSTQHRGTNLTASYGLPTPSNYHSYEIFSWIGKGTYPTGEFYKDHILITRRTKNPARLWIPMDDVSGGINNWPDAVNHHGESGLNLGYVDGHAGWHDRPAYVRAAIDSYHPWFGPNNATSGTLAQSVLPYVVNVGGWHGVWSYQY